MANHNKSRWLFTPEELKMTPSIRQGMTQLEEINQRQQAATLIRKIGSKLKESCRRPSGLCLDSAMVFMHRFYMFHSFYNFSPQAMAPCCLFLAAKSEEVPIKLEYVIKTTNMLLMDPNLPSLTERLFEQMEREIISNENLLLQTLGFDLLINHPHTSVIHCGELVGAPKSVIKLAYDLATNSLHFTTMCLKYESTTVAGVCLFMAFKSKDLSIDKSKEGKEWWTYIDPNLKLETIEDIWKEFVATIGTCKKNFSKWMPSNNQQPVSVESSTGPNCLIVNTKK